MIIDAQNLFSDEQALAASAVSTNVIDTVVDGNLGVGEPMAVVVTLDVAADDTDADETYSVVLQASSDEAFSAPVSVASKDIVRGAAAGSKIVFGVPADDSGDRYYRLSYVLGGTTPSVTVTSFLIPQSMVQNDFKFASGFTVA